MSLEHLLLACVQLDAHVRTRLLLQVNLALPVDRLVENRTFLHCCTRPLFHTLPGPDWQNGCADALWLCLLGGKRLGGNLGVVGIVLLYLRVGRVENGSLGSRGEEVEEPGCLCALDEVGLLAEGVFGGCPAFGLGTQSRKERVGELSDRLGAFGGGERRKGPEAGDVLAPLADFAGEEALNSFCGGACRGHSSQVFEVYLT